MPPRKHFEETIEHIASIFIETLNVSDRVAAISCAALLDDILGAVLAARFIKLGKDWQDRIFSDPSATLGTFYSKILIGYAIGVFGPMTRANLDIIRSVRNDFAHSATPLTFDEEDIAKKCRRLVVLHPSTIPSEYIPEWIIEASNKPRNRYISTSQWLSIDLSMIRKRRLKINFPSFLR